ncbi:MAG TPA: type II toxin-antitoxin system VapC family toxin [Bryobacteraceae bacterium]|nr:type II toxin-antitoxin system VapC family toxin [Bryobacteraceae bacterium]
MPGFVVDASATLPWCFEDEATPATEALLERLRAGEPVVVPAHWSTEVMNGLMMAVRRSRIDLERVARFARDLAALPILIEPPYAPAAWEAVIRVASLHQLTIYDAAYLELAERTGLPLATSMAICEQRRWPQAWVWWKDDCIIVFHARD